VNGSPESLHLVSGKPQNLTILINSEGDIIKQIGQLYLCGILQSSCDKKFQPDRTKFKDGFPCHNGKIV